jgi:DNA-binding CsgD family transcriptional regulator
MATSIIMNIKLTPRERDVLLWASEGKSAWEIGRILSITERTAKFHLSNIYRKLDVHTRTQAVANAIRYGILEDINPTKQAS